MFRGTDGIRKSQQTPGGSYMQVFDQLAVDHYDALTFGPGLLKCGDDSFCFDNFVVGGCEDLIGGGYLAGMDQGLTDEAELPP